MAFNQCKCSAQLTFEGCDCVICSHHKERTHYYISGSYGFTSQTFYCQEKSKTVRCTLSGVERIGEYVCMILWKTHKSKVKLSYYCHAGDKGERTCRSY
jgi:hypothetical protein